MTPATPAKDDEQNTRNAKQKTWTGDGHKLVDVWNFNEGMGVFCMFLLPGSLGNVFKKREGNKK